MGQDAIRGTKGNDTPAPEGRDFPEPPLGDLRAQGISIEEFRPDTGSIEGFRTLSLNRKKGLVAAALHIIAKDGNNQAQNFKYATHTSLISALKPLLAEQGLVLHSTCVGSKTQIIEKPDGRKQFLSEVQMLYHLIDIETGEYDESTFFGQALDTGDKAIYKAYTGPLKYYILQNLLIATGDAKDNEVETDEEMAYRERKANRVMAQAGFKGKIDYATNPGEWELITVCSKQGEKIKDLPVAYLKKAITDHAADLEKDDLAYMTQYLSSTGHLPVVPGAL